NTAWASSGKAPGDPGAFYIDTAPANPTVSLDTDYSDETQFVVSDGGNGTIDVQVLGASGTAVGTQTPLVISTSGWFTFKTTFQEDASGNVENVLSVLNASGTTLDSVVIDDPNMSYSNLEGPAYGDWTTIWTDGFANDQVGID